MVVSRFAVAVSFATATGAEGAGRREDCFGVTGAGGFPPEQANRHTAVQIMPSLMLTVLPFDLTEITRTNPENTSRQPLVLGAGSQLLECRLVGIPSANFLRVGLYYSSFRRMFGTHFDPSRNEAGPCFSLGLLSA